MKDSELLKAAAKAVNGGAWHPLTHDTPNGVWNPLQDDGDAFRLAVKLRIDVVFEKQHTVAAYTDRDEWFYEHCEDGMGADIEVKTRRAIVRAAASMGGAE